MTANTITFMGIPITDTLRVVDALNEFVETRVTVCEELAEDYDETEFYSPDEYDNQPFREPMRFPKSDWYDDFTTLRRLNNRWRAESRGFCTKSKEVK